MSESTKIGLTLRQAVDLSGVGRNSLLEAVNAGELPAARIGAAESKRKRFIIRPDDLDLWLRQKSGRE